ncbi:hypothetical protein BT96DRAFT_1011790 [Gymnopus androsaceus JB14]|uniref:Uncharacterized protein n=1 Tax=Gymnopus androsaceus JB14 TaxID=1447944 RepID=A0A6A4IQY4_9AGAR|nr:hypothetical protein BT96DRAFT_1011790 [Gymnopus androsaceus JB14]
MSSNPASFAPYMPPPDDPQYTGHSKAPSRSRPWFPSQQSSQGVSYQSGGIPTFNNSQAGGFGNTASEEVESQNQWETRYGMRVDMLSAFAYILGPLSALLVLIIETQNDYVRFHAYQSALFTTPLVVFRAFLSLLQFPQWLRTFCTVLVLVCQLYMAFRAYIDASRNGLARFELPVVGPLASRWLADE